MHARREPCVKYSRQVPRQLFPPLERFAMMGRAMGEPEAGQSLQDIAPRAVRAIKRLFSDLGFPRKFTDSQMDRRLIPQMANMIMREFYGEKDLNKEYPLSTLVPSANIRRATMKDVIELFEKAFEGWDL